MIKQHLREQAYIEVSGDESQSTLDYRVQLSLGLTRRHDMEPVVGIVDASETVRQALERLIYIGLGLHVRSAASFGQLLDGLPPDLALMLVVGPADTVGDRLRMPPLGTIIIDHTPIDAEALLTEIRERILRQPARAVS